MSRIPNKMSQLGNNFLKVCACGCGEVVTALDRRTRFKRFHQPSNKGKHWTLSAETKRKQGIAKLDEKNPQWKGDQKIDYVGLHVYVRRRLPKPLVCQICKIKSPYDLANITGIYTRDLKNWQYLCRKCHMLSDGRMNNLKQFGTLK